MFLNLIFIFSTITHLISCQPPVPPNDGHYFYVDMSKGLHNKIKDSSNLDRFVNILITDYNKSLSLNLNTMEDNTWIVSGECMLCQTPNNFTLEYVDYKGGEQRQVTIFNKMENNLTGTSYDLTGVVLNATRTDNLLKFQVNEFQREASNDMSFLYVTNSSKPFKSPYDGFIGIKPKLSPNTMRYEYSDVISDMLYKKMIDHPIVSIYTRTEFGNSSIIKFGGWDQSALKDGTNLTMYKIGSDDQGGDLALKANMIEMGNLSFISPYLELKTQRINFNPAVPFVYTNSASFKTIIDVLKSNYTNSTGFSCDGGQCYFPHSCEQLVIWGVRPANIIIHLENNYNYTINWDYLLTNGKFFNPVSKGFRCYLAFFEDRYLPDGQW